MRKRRSPSSRMRVPSRLPSSSRERSTSVSAASWMLASGLLNSCDTAARKFCCRRRSSASCRSVRVSTAMPPISTTRKKPPSQRIRLMRASLSSATAGSLAKRCFDAARVAHAVVHPPADLRCRDRQQREEADLHRLGRVAPYGHDSCSALRQSDSAAAVWSAARKPSASLSMSRRVCASDRNAISNADGASAMP